MLSPSIFLETKVCVQDRTLFFSAHDTCMYFIQRNKMFSFPSCFFVKEYLFPRENEKVREKVFTLLPPPKKKKFPSSFPSPILKRVKKRWVGRGGEEERGTIFTRVHSSPTYNRTRRSGRGGGGCICKSRKFQSKHWKR